MTPERWHLIDQLFHTALEQDPAERAEFLAAQCDGDEPLRLEVESLISFHEKDDSFIERPAGDVAAELIGAQESTLAAGHLIGNYRIVRLLGSGGMGEVYLADDTRLNRKVALKRLPPHYVINPDRVRRFQREARAASALSHPNIVTIYEIEHSNSAHFIATEFIDGKTLRQLISERPLTLNEALNVAIQVADALRAAHAAGIVHRDIKPENIMVRADGYMKILDFGLAKLTERHATDLESEMPTLLQSNPGLVLGTVQYMSPEQARAKKVDARTDIWSLGIVLYELLAGRVPFSGETASHVMVSLMEDQLPPLSPHANVPPELERIVTKATRKNQKERYQTAAQIFRDLKELKEKLQLEARFKGSLEVVTSLKQTTAKVDRRPKGAVADQVTPTANVERSHQTSSVEYPGAKILNAKKAWIVVLALSLLAGAVAVGSYLFVPRNRSAVKSAVAFQATEFIKLTNTGRIKDAVISPDGKYVAYVAYHGGKEGIWLREVTTSNEVELVSPADLQYHSTTFSHDSSNLYYILNERSSSIGKLHRVPVRGGPSVRLIVDVDGPVSFSPAGKQIAFVRGSSSGERALMVANSDGSGEYKLASRTGFGAFSFGGPAWSPDGRIIACGAAATDENGRYMTLMGVELSDGSIKPLTGEKWRLIGRVWWLNEGNGIVFAATDRERGSSSKLWSLSYPGGEVRRITSGFQDYDGVSLTSDSRILASRQRRTLSSLWIAPNNDADRAKQILANVDDGNNDSYTRTRFSWMPDGRIIYTSEMRGIPSIWVMTAEGTGHNQLTTGPSANGFPSVTSDSRRVVFVSDRTGFTNVWRMDADGTNERQLTNGEDDSWAWCAPNGKWVVYHNGDNGKRTLRRVSIEGGASEKLTDYTSLCPVVSPDSRWISCYYRSETKAPWQLAILPFEGGPPVKTFDIPPNVLFPSVVQWTPDGLGLAYIATRDGVSNIWVQPLEGGQPRQLTDFKSDQISWFDWSPDGRQLGVSRGAVTSDVVLIRDLTPESTTVARGQ